MGVSSTPLAVEAYRRLLIVRRVADGIVWNHHRHIVTNPEFRLFVLEQEFGQKRGGCLGKHRRPRIYTPGLDQVRKTYASSHALCQLRRKGKIANRSLQKAKEKTKLANRSLQTLSARPTRFPVAPEGKMPDTPWTWSDLDTLAEPGNMPY